MKNITLIFVIFTLGLIFMCINKPLNIVERFSMNNKNNDKYRCPNVLIQKDKYIFLYNSHLAPVPGVNPLKFNDLNEYTEFTKWQRSQGIRCPVLFLRHSYDAQGNAVYKARPSPTDLQGGLEESKPKAPRVLAQQSLLLDANRNDPPYNENQVPGFDSHDQYIGLDTPLDKMFNDKTGVSANPMDNNWGGDKYTRNLIKQGYYKGNEVSLYVD